MKSTTRIITIAALACSAVMAASTGSSSSSVIKCKTWEGECLDGSIHDKTAKRTSCKDRSDSSMACVDLCCKPFVAPSPTPKASTFIKCKVWEGVCGLGSERDGSGKNKRCKDRTDSTDSCFDLCCTPPAQPSSFIKCKRWDGECRMGTNFNRDEKNTRCKDRGDSTDACADLCCTPFVAPTPDIISTVIKCKDWEGDCLVGTHYDRALKNTRCKDRLDSTMVCVEECCTYQ